MKRIFTLLSFVFALIAIANAQITYPHTWDFTKWSETTVENLKAESAKGATTGAWSDVESIKNGNTTPADAAIDNCFWMVAEVAGGLDDDGNLAANGATIEETRGLKFINTDTRNLAIAVNYPKALSDYHGGSYLWLGGANKNFLTIPAVPEGAVIEIGVESHKTTDARGVKLYMDSKELLDANFDVVDVPTIYKVQTWKVTGVTEATHDIVVDNTNGCHIYYIKVTLGEKVAPAPEASLKAVYSWSSVGPNDEDITEFGGKATHENGTKNDRVNYKSGDSSNPIYSICVIGKSANLATVENNDDASYIQILLDKSVESGDVIRLTGFVYKAGEEKKANLYISFRGEDKELANNVMSDYFPNIAEGGKPAGTEPGEFTIIVPEKADGCNKIWLTRKTTGTSVFLSKIEILKATIDAPENVDGVSTMLNQDRTKEIVFTPAHVSHLVYTFFEAAKVEEGAPTEQALAQTITHEGKEFTLAENNTFTANKAGTLHYMSVDKNSGVKSEVKQIEIAEYGGDTSAIFELEAEEAEGVVEYYNLQGVRVANPTPGLYIRKQGNKVEKVYVK